MASKFCGCWPVRFRITRSIRSPDDLVRRASSQLSSNLIAPRDRVTARQERVAQFVDRLGWIAVEQIPEHATGDGRETVVAGVEAADVVGEDQLGVL